MERGLSPSLSILRSDSPMTVSRMWGRVPSKIFHIRLELGKIEVEMFGVAQFERTVARLGARIFQLLGSSTLPQLSH
jgi:hypothetical protein